MISILVTGGTFDKQYNFVTGELIFFESHIEEMLKKGRCALDVEVRTLFMLDSREMTSQHRDEILTAVKNCKYDKVVITHGTDTMAKTAQFLDDNIVDLEKTVVLTGAMIPYAFGSSSDGFFNLGNAIAYASALPIGVYVAMNGRHYKSDRVRKNYTTGFFEEHT